MPKLKPKRGLAALLCLALVLSLLGVLPVQAAECSALTVTGETALKGESVTVQINLQNTAQIIGGAMDIRYDPAALTLQGVEALTWNGGMIQANQRYAEDTVRVTLAGSNALPTACTLLTLTFSVSKTAKPGSYPVMLENVRLYDSTPSVVAYRIENGGVTVPGVRLRVQTVEAVASQSVKVQITLDDGLYPTGGSFEIRYDAARLTAGVVAKGSALPNSTMLTANPKDGVIPVFWAGMERAEAGVLCTLTFSVKSGASGTLPISIHNARVYDENAAPMDPVSENGAIRIVAPTETSPKLWVVGGMTGGDSTATAGIVLEGRGVICGGSFTLTYDANACELIEVEIPAELSSLAVVNSPLADGKTGGKKEAPGTVQFIWADAAPSVSSQLMLKLRFRVRTVGSELKLSDVQTLNADAAAVAHVDLRHGSICGGTTTLQLPDTTVEASVTAAGTTVRAALDVANAMQFTDGEQNVRIFVGLYENGRMKLVQIDPSSIVFDENGIASVSVEASCTGRATLAKLFFLQAGTNTPCAGNTTVELSTGD